MKRDNHISLAIAAACVLCACNNVDEKQFVGTWLNECEVEVDGLGFYQQIETLTLNEDNSFSQRMAYLDDTHTDTIATASINGTWEINDSCLEFRFNPSTIFVTSVTPEHESIFFNNTLSHANYDNQQLTTAHNNNESYGIRHVAIESDRLVSKGLGDNSTIEVYSLKK